MKKKKHSEICSFKGLPAEDCHVCGKIDPYLEEKQAKQMKNLIANMRKKVNKNFAKEKDLFTPIFEEMKRLILSE